MNPRYGWVMVALGAFMTCIAIGAMFSLAVFLQPITEIDRLVAHRGVGRHDASTSWRWARRASAGARSATASARASSCWPARCSSGSACSSRAARRARSQFQLAFGLLVGIAIGSFFSPMIAAVMGWIDRASRPRGGAGLGRRRRRADDHVAVRRLADHADGLARGAGGARRAGVGDAGPGGAVRAPAAGGAGGGGAGRGRTDRR